MSPYQVLGINENASDDEVRRAYRELVKKYHPDQYGSNPLADLAQEKLKEINEAYDTIMKQRQGKGGGGYAGAGTGSPQFAAVRAYINQNNLVAARNALAGITTKNAEWYFLDGVIALRMGWYDNARSSFSTAVQMDPNNPEYRTAYNSMNNANMRYTSNPYATSGAGNDALCRTCQALWCADCCCECCGGDLIRCC
ncbi:MAG: J domain-containing protein [Christensenellales bacterium]